MSRESRQMGGREVLMFVFNKTTAVVCIDLSRPRVKVPLSTSGESSQPQRSLLTKCDLSTMHNANDLCPRPVGVSGLQQAIVCIVSLMVY
jgi:hypothetical protein